MVEDGGKRWWVEGQKEIQKGENVFLIGTRSLRPIDGIHISHAPFEEHLSGDLIVIVDDLDLVPTFYYERHYCSWLLNCVNLVCGPFCYFLNKQTTAVFILWRARRANTYSQFVCSTFFREEVWKFDEQQQLRKFDKSREQRTKSERYLFNCSTGNTEVEWVNRSNGHYNGANDSSMPLFWPVNLWRNDWGKCPVHRS